MVGKRDGQRGSGRRAHHDDAFAEPRSDLDGLDAVSQPIFRANTGEAATGQAVTRQAGLEQVG